MRTFQVASTSLPAILTTDAARASEKRQEDATKEEIMINLLLFSSIL
jgi:hypothetical protein